MSGKYAKKKNNPVLLTVLVILLVAAAAAVAMLKMSGDAGDVAPTGPDTAATTAPSEEHTQPVTEEPTEAPTELPKPEGIDLGNGMVITNVGAYSGAYVEDGTDEQVTDVMMIEVYNYGVEAIQYAEISLGDAEFVLTTLPVGQSVRVLEKNRMAVPESAEFDVLETRNVAFFQNPMSLCTDKLQIQMLDGAMNIRNVSGEDIQGDIFVYYKNVSDGVLMGGITYRAHLTDGLKADEVRQVLANHYTIDGSRVMFVTCG